MNAVLKLILQSAATRRLLPAWEVRSIKIITEIGNPIKKPFIFLDFADGIFDEITCPKIRCAHQLGKL